MRNIPSSRLVVLALLVISLGLAIANPSGNLVFSQLFFRLSYLFGGILLVSWGMSLLALRGVQARRTARTLRSQVGQVFEERYEVLNTSRLPHLWIEVRDESPLPGSFGSHVLTTIGGREMRTYLARTRLVQRGVYPLGPTILASGDLFGLFPVSRRVPNRDSILVYPMMVEVRSFPNPPGLLPGGEALRRRTMQITSNAAGVREYEPGDPINRIHWISTARRNRLMVKEFELDPLAEVWIFVDAAKSAQVERPQAPVQEFDVQDIWRRKFKFTLPGSTLEYSVTIAASLARYYIQRGRAVGLVYASQSLHILPSDRGGRQLGKILESLALVQADGNIPLHGVVEAQARHLPRGSTVVMITPSSSESVYQTADLLTRRGLRPVTALLDGTSFGGPSSPERVAANLRVLRIPYCIVKEGDNLSDVLSSAVYSLQMGG